MTTPLEQATHLGSMAADDVAIGFTGTGAERTRAVVERTLEALEANGIITIHDPKTWPKWFTPYPPFSAPESGAESD